MPAAATRTTERQCLVSGESYSKDALIRFVIGPDGQLVPDVAGKLPGRGMWVKADAQSVETALEKQLFSRSAKQSIRIPDGTADLLYKLMHERALQSIAIARKAGAAIHGFDKIKEAIAKQSVVALMHASDAGKDGKAKLKADDSVFTCDWFSREQLSQMMGVENAVHVAIAPVDKSQDFLRDLRRFAGFVKETPL